MVNKLTTPYVKIIRPANAAMTGFAVILGIWIAGGLASAPAPGANPYLAALLLAGAAMAAAAYGNAVNDLFDIRTDRISHPDRPLANGTMSVRAAVAFAAVLALASLACAWAASGFHLAATAAPLALLTLYSIYFKRTRIAGNVVVATLTAYAFVFGSLPRPETKILIGPAVLAFLLNFCREVAKDVQDADGDRAAGLRTSADLPAPAIRAVMAAAAGAHIIIVFMPSLVFGHFGWGYTAFCAAAVIPLHIYWMALALKSPDGIKRHAGRISAVLKLEMLAGLFALALDKAIYYFY